MRKKGEAEKVPGPSSPWQADLYLQDALDLLQRVRETFSWLVYTVPTIRPGASNASICKSL